MRCIREKQCPWLSWLCPKLMSNSNNIDVYIQSTLLYLGWEFGASALLMSSRWITPWDRICNPSLELIITFELCNTQGTAGKTHCWTAWGSRDSSGRAFFSRSFCITYLASLKIFCSWKSEFAGLHSFRKNLCFKIQGNKMFNRFYIY